MHSSRTSTANAQEKPVKYLLSYGISLVLFLVIDALWLGTVARGFYFNRLGELLLEQPRWGVAALFYLVYALGLTYFAIVPAMQAGSWVPAAINGALFGFFAYFTYNATSLSVLKGYDPTVAMIDTGWGTICSGLVAGATAAIMVSARNG